MYVVSYEPDGKLVKHKQTIHGEDLEVESILLQLPPKPMIMHQIAWEMD